MMLPLVLEVSPEALAVIVRVPAVLKVKLDKLRVPATRVMLPAVPPLSSAIVALASVVVIVTLGVAVLTTFQLASTALTVTLMSVPVVWADAVPDLPFAVPGAAVSPGTSN